MHIKTKPKTFALLGAAGYIAPRHMEAIHSIGGELVAALDKSDSVGILDRYFPNTAFFTEFERFDRHLEKLKRQGEAVDYVVVCTPNYLHDAHIRFGLRLGADVICEKPLVLNPWNLNGLKEMEEEADKKIFQVLQLRLHPAIIALKKEVEQSSVNKIFDIELTYITSRGMWYYASWKGDESKSGGVATNIGVHFFDMLLWVFGAVKKSEVHVRTHDRTGGYLELEKAKVKWFLSINESTLPMKLRLKSQNIYRSMKVNENEINFSAGFEELHKKSYTHILDNEGFELSKAWPTIELIHQIRKANLSVNPSQIHRLSKLAVVAHPFND